MLGSFLATSITLFAVDQLTKLWAVGALAHQPDGLHLPTDVVRLSLVCNKGAAFGILPSHPWVFTVASIALLVMVFATARAWSRDHAWHISLGLLAGGTGGNLADRLRLGFVVDFVELRWGGRPVWPTFNIADIAIAVGAVLLTFMVLRRDRPNLPKAPSVT
ncbi:MAG: signal peptidase II [Armatimonadota bacterium]